ELRRTASTAGNAPAEQLEVQVGLARPNPAIYFGGTDTLPDVRFLIWRRELAAFLRRWQSMQNNGDALLRGSTLVEAREWLSERADELSQAESDFINASIGALEQAEAAEQARIAAEREAFETRERERSEAAEKLAAERGARLHIEEMAREKAQQHASRLKKW